MTLLSSLRQPARMPLRADATTILASTVLLAGLALADRAAAWLIGAYPSSAIAWQLRFEFLRPVGVYYDVASLGLGALSPAAFCSLVLAISAALVIAALSRIRLLRALACHTLCGLAGILWLCSMQYREGIYAPAGAPSPFYAVVGATLALATAVLCLGIHAEYLGWNPVASAALRRSRIAIRRAQRRLEGTVTDLLDRFGTNGRPTQVAVARVRSAERPSSDR